MKPKNKRPDISLWEQNRGVIRTKKGGWIPGEAVYCHGYSMMDDLVGHASYFQVLLLDTTGRFPERRLADWFEAVFTCMSYPDARIWCNQIGSLSGTIQASPVAGICSGMLATDSRCYGAGTLPIGADFIATALAQKNQGWTVEEIVLAHQQRPGIRPPITGYVRPMAHGDERVETLQRLAESLGFPIGEHLALGYEISDYLEKTFREGINLTGYVTAFLLDNGFSINEIYRVLAAFTLAGIQACYAEAADNPPCTFFPLQCEDIEYTGHEERPVP